MKTRIKFIVFPLTILIFFFFSGTTCKKENGEDPAPVIKLPVLTTSEVTGITKTSATGGGTITSDGGTEITSRGIVWNTNPNPTTENYKTTDGAGIGNFSSNMTGLEYNTKYYVRAYATNSEGTAYGNSVTFRTHGIVGGSGTVTDIDGNTYQTIIIGTQEWMAENLAYLPSVSPPSEESGTNPHYYVYGYNGTNISEAKDTENFDTYGVLYNWVAATTACPAGWRLPTDNDWKEMEMSLGMSEIEANEENWRGTNEGSKLAGNYLLWITGDLTNNYEFWTSAFAALPGGYRFINGTFGDIKYRGKWWTDTEFPGGSYSWARELYYHNTKVSRFIFLKEYGYSVRCVKE